MHSVWKVSPTPSLTHVPSAGSRHLQTGEDRGDLFRGLQMQVKDIYFSCSQIVSYKERTLYYSLSFDWAHWKPLLLLCPGLKCPVSQLDLDKQEKVNLVMSK